MGKCEMCDKDIDDKYKFCMRCSMEMKKANEATGAVRPQPQIDVNAITNKLDQLNNNLYAQRTILNALLEETAGKTCYWDVETKTFKIGESNNILRSSNYVLWMLMEELMKEQGKIIGWNNLEKKFEIQKIGKAKLK